MTVLRIVGVFSIAAAVVPSLARAQAANIVIQGRIQAQYRSSGGDSTANYNPNTPTNGFEIRRARIQTNVRFGDNINLVIQPSLEMSTLRLRDAFVRVGFTPALGLSMGQEKSPFQRYELNTSNNLPSIERGLRVLGLSGREGLNDLLVSNGYSSHDIGAFLDYTPSDSRFSVKLGIQNGSRESAVDVNKAKSFFGRLTATALMNRDNQPALQLGFSFADRDRAVCSTTPCAATPVYAPRLSRRTQAYGIDLEWGGFRPGFHAIIDFAAGDNVPVALRVNSGRNTANVRDMTDANIATFRGVNAVLAWRVNTSGPDTRIVKILEPALRIDVTDPNGDTPNDAGLLITPVVNVYFAPTTIMRAGLDFYRYRTAAGVQSKAWELKVSWQANF
jgi:hypothetical protein